MVVYHMRPGHGRNGKTYFPAVVQGHGDRDTLMLTIIIDAGDFNDESLVEERRVGTEFHCWERVDTGFQAQTDFADTAARDEIDGIMKAVFGEFVMPPVSLCEIMNEFEGRLRELKRENDTLRQLIGMKMDMPDMRKGKGK